jgi:hypothetical protein
MSYKKQELPTLVSRWVHLQCFDCICVARLLKFSVLCFLFYVFSFCILCPMLPVSLDYLLLIAPSDFSNVYILYTCFKVRRKKYKVKDSLSYSYKSIYSINVSSFYFQCKNFDNVFFTEAEYSGSYLLTLPLFTGVSPRKSLISRMDWVSCAGDINLPHTPFPPARYPTNKKIKYNKILTYILRSIFLEIPHLELPHWWKMPRDTNVNDIRLLICLTPLQVNWVMEIN